MEQISSTPSYGLYKSEIAAYEVDKLLELGMVPLTVEREINGKKGSFQLWVNHLEGTELPLPNDGRFFDYLIDQNDRGVMGGYGNFDFLAYDSNQAVLFDNARGFYRKSESVEGPTAENASQFKPSASVLEKARRLDKPMLEQIEWLTLQQRKDLLERRDILIKAIDQEA